MPAPNVFLQVNPIQLTFDPLTCIWLNRFAQSVATGLVREFFHMSLFISGEKIFSHVFILSGAGEQVSSGIGNISNWRGLKQQ